MPGSHDPMSAGVVCRVGHFSCYSPLLSGRPRSRNRLSITCRTAGKLNVPEGDDFGRSPAHFLCSHLLPSARSIYAPVDPERGVEDSGFLLRKCKVVGIVVAADSITTRSTAE